MSVRPKKTLVQLDEAQRKEMRSWILPLVEEALSSDYMDASIDNGVVNISSLLDTDKRYAYSGRRTLTISWRH